LDNDYPVLPLVAPILFIISVSPEVRAARTSREMPA
jgi:hypothetical protein